jgi:pectin methylesterase-like acyl-CoA thioesterase
MKTKLQVILFAMLLSISFAQAQKIDVWDLGGQALDASLYNNKLTVANINAWYPGITAGTSGVTLPNSTVLTLTAGVLTLTTGGSDRLYTTNPDPTNNPITRYATGSIGTTDTNYTARYYCNGAASATSRFFSLTLNADDEVTIVASTESAGNSLTVVNTTTNTQTVTLPVTVSGAAVTLAKFVAKDAGVFKISSLVGKGDYFRIYRKPVTPVTLTGNMDVTAAPGIPDGYSVLFTNTFTGKTYAAPVTAGTYSASNVPAGFTYKMGLVNASGFIISNGENFTVTDATTVTHDISVIKVDLFNVSGNVTGLGTKISNATLVYTPSTAKVYVPQPVITTATATYAVSLEANVPYTITATGINDFELLSNTITATATTVSNLDFTAKPVYPVTITTTGLTTTQINALTLTFTNLNESGYSYTFAPGAAINLRNGTYTVSYTGLDTYAVQAGLISNVKVNSAPVTKTIAFSPVSVWSFEDKTITTSTTAYKGMLFAGTAATISNQIASGHLLAKTGGIIKIPVVADGDKVTISYYYSANFNIEGGTAITTTSGSTAIVENVVYTYNAATATNLGFVTLNMLGSNYTTYFPEIKIGSTTAYTSPITVGTDKTYKTINDALTAVSNMNRTATDRVVIMIDPGNYEEMLTITQANVTLKNAATTPSIALSNKGVDIDANAVRITSYYGHGVAYYSMAADQKWHADVLAVNKENGYMSYSNAGAGTTNGSYWNATVAINANGFQADNIIFENSFNQYVSKKESEDIMVLLFDNKGGVRPTAIGSTDVQNKSFVERAAAIAIFNNIDKVILNKCRVIGRQDSFYGGTGARVAVYKGEMMGGTDYIFGGMNATFYKSNLVMNTSDVSSDVSYITAAQQATGRGFLMYECKVTTAIPGTETASAYRSKPGYFGRPWAATTSEVVFYNTTIETSDFTGYEGQSLIMPIGWNNSLGGTSPKMYEYGTIENSGVNNGASRATWATLLATPTLTDGTTITTFNFTKGADNWDPFLSLIAADNALGTNKYQVNSSVNAYAYKNNIVVSNVKSKTKVLVYGINGALVKSFETNADTNFDLKAGVWIIVLKAADGQKSVKLMTY